MTRNMIESCSMRCLRSEVHPIFEEANAIKNQQGQSLNLWLNSLHSAWPLAVPMRPTFAPDKEGKRRTYNHGRQQAHM
jgi:hypothetical protein